MDNPQYSIGSTTYPGKAETLLLDYSISWGDHTVPLPVYRPITMTSWTLIDSISTDTGWKGEQTLSPMFDIITHFVTGIISIRVIC